MKANPRSETKGVGDPLPDDRAIDWYGRVRDVREDFGRRIGKISAKAAPTIADRLRLAYYQNVLRLFESLPPGTLVNAGFMMGRHCSDHQQEVREINEILDYLPDSRGRAPHGRSLYLGPVSTARSPTKGRPVTRRSAALRALQLQIDTGRTWTSITQEVCDCKKEHDQSCRENIRQGVNGLKRLLRRLGIQFPPEATHRGG
jgi:hypothetical protein